MKLLATLLPLLASLVLAQGPTSCDREDKELRGSDFVLLEKPDNPNVASLASILADRRTTVAEVFEDGNHQMTDHSDTGGLQFESTDDFDDVNTEKWYPQGISSTADALDAGTYEGRDGFVVSWHDAGDESVRVTFVDRETKKYRHVLLVYPHAEDDFRAVPIHAGGVVWYGDTLWVVDTSNGIRVFDLANIWRVDSGDGVGKTGDDGTYSAQGYKYVLPQIAWYEFTPAFNFQHSYISLDRTATAHSILVGEFRRNSTEHPIRMARYELDREARRLRTDDEGHARAAWAYCVDVERTQGAVQVGLAVYMSRSNGQDAGEVFTWTPGGPAEVTALFPKGPEDLTYDKRTEEIFTVTEHPGLRVIVGTKLSELQLS
ncbi:hypothetical protein VUR80DRAFT_4856 [Thermomyces stellatus]